MSEGAPYARFNEQFWVGAIVALGGAALLIGGYSGWVGEWWAREGHDKPALILAVLGLGLVGFGLLRERAERLGTERARKQFEIAARVAGVFFVVALAGAAILTAFLVALVLAVLVPPWLHDARSGRDYLFEALSGRSTLAIAGAILGAMMVAAAVEFFYRRFALRPTQANDIDPLPSNAGGSFLEATPSTISAIASLFQLCISAIFLLLGLGALATALSENAPLFPDTLAQMFVWLGQNLNMKWALPVCGTMIASIVLLLFYRRARWDRLGPGPMVLDAIQTMVLISAATGLLGVAAMVLAVNFGAR